MALVLVAVFANGELEILAVALLFQKYDQADQADEHGQNRPVRQLEVGLYGQEEHHRRLAAMPPYYRDVVQQKTGARSAPAVDYT